MKLPKILYGFLLLFIAALLWSCKPRELPKEKEVVTITKTITEVKRDTIVKIPADSTFYEAMIKCQNGVPILIQPSVFPKNKASLEFTSDKSLQTPKVSLDTEGKLKISCQLLAQQLIFTLKEKHILQEKLSEKVITPPPIYIEKQLTWWQKLWLNLGKVFSAGLLIFLLTKIPWKVFLKL